MAEIICLANSWRPGGRCVAGIDRATGKWVRPVPTAGGAIPERCTWLGTRHMLPLDVVEMSLQPPKLDTQFQCENCVIESWGWRLVGQVAAADVLRYCTPSAKLLHSETKIVEPARMAALPPSRWTSLELVHVHQPVFEPDPRKPERWQGRFRAARWGPEYCLPVTDPVATERLKAGGAIAPECLLTVSLTAPIEIIEFGKPKLCYKLIAAVIELPTARPATGAPCRSGRAEGR